MDIHGVVKEWKPAYILSVYHQLHCLVIVDLAPALGKFLQPSTVNLGLTYGDIPRGVQVDACRQGGTHITLCGVP